ncbi:MAG TPA: type II secretion system protein [Tepidisphaeraceae bacterium]|jgi:prepilin-type N-terminal cleavage/methylation domain-containing protein|nr:type II secretion system protein [Tepidisphaeraceae bacterium]
MSKRQGFSLVELLVVIGIIAVLIALLMPALSEARQNANRTVCLSNLRQLAIAFIMYANDNRGYFPNSSPSDNESPSDWIYYQAARVQSQSAIVAYVGGTFNPNVFRCPSDDWTYRPRTSYAYGGPYDYSYSMNLLMSSDTSEGSFTIYQYGTIPSPDQKILLVCEDAVTLDDGSWNPGNVNNQYEDTMAIRHDRPLPTSIPDIPYLGDPNDQDNGYRGNVACVDGHAEFVTRAWTRIQFHYDPSVKQ